MQWVLPNDEVDVLFVDESPSDVQVASAVEMKVTQTDPGVKGDTANPKGETFEVTGDFNAEDVVKALHAAGYHVKVK